MASASEIKKILDKELKLDKLGDNFKIISEKAIKIFQRLFVEQLNYDLVKGDFGAIGEDILTDEWNTAAEAEEAYLIAEKDEFRVIYIVIKKLTQGRERNSISSIKRLKWAKKREYICVFYSRDSLVWDMVCPHIEKEKITLRRFILGDGENHRTVSENLSLMDATDVRPLFERVQEAFKVQAVTEEFFEDYMSAFFRLKNELTNQSIPKIEAHEFTLQLLNRIMFIYFISKKEKWLNTKNLIGWLWKFYEKEEQFGTNKFYEIWLKQVFFKAFNNKENEIIDLPDDMIREINNFPFLNGGLFTSNSLDELKITFTDEFLSEIIDFFENYNFTIREDMPFDIEVAVDPQMIGYVYESLANVAEEIYDRNDMGIFYTPRIEVDFMARRLIVEYLSKNFPTKKKEIFYQIVFTSVNEKELIKGLFNTKDIWYEIETCLDDLSAVDPACGSGAFLVGLLNVLTEIYKKIHEQIGRQDSYTDFELKKRIIQYSLYGVDVMPWAVHATELRLWLQLIIESPLEKDELRQHPLLPNLELNIRIGDSLVQEIGGLFFNIRNSNLKGELKKKLNNLKQEKRYYFDNIKTGKFKNIEDIQNEEIRIFGQIIEDQIKKIELSITNLKKEIKKAKSQKTLTGGNLVNTKKLDKINTDLHIKNEILKNLINKKKVLNQPGRKPFIWDVDFAEIFGGKNGFDIVIGNPPYVRQELISPPNKLKTEIDLSQKREYKAKLISSVNSQFPVIKKLDKKSDLYIYFFFHGLSLLNEKGFLCYITSSSWLDVGFGKNLQDFLLKYVPIVAIYDYPYRVFEHADINTTITLLGSPKIIQKKIGGLSILSTINWPQVNHQMDFVMFNKKLEEVINFNNLVNIEKINVKKRGNEISELTDNIIKTENYRVFPIIQEDLLNLGWKYPLNYKINQGKFKRGGYTGYKWGGTFLRSPEIIFKILKKGKNKFVKLGELTKEIKRGFTTGVNEFFYLPSKYFDLYEFGNYYNLIPKKEKLPSNLKIEKEFLRPVIKSLREVKKGFVDLNSLNHYVFYCKIPKKSLIKKQAIQYIQWGESQEFNNRSTCRSRKLWYSLPDKEISNLLYSYISGSRHLIPKNNVCLADNNLFDIYSRKSEENKLFIIMNSAIFRLFLENMGRDMTGSLTVLKIQIYELEDMLVLNIENDSSYKEIVNAITNRKINNIFEEYGFNPDEPITDAHYNPLEDRIALDNIIFNELSLSEKEGKEVIFSVCKLIQRRLKKSKSVKFK